MINRKDLRQKYLNAAGKFSLEAEKEDKNLLLLSLLRFLCFAGGITVTALLFLHHSPAFGILSSFLTVILFLFLLKLYSDHIRKKEFVSALSKINSDEAAALDGDLSPFKPGDEYSDHSHDFSYDVDLFGNDSLFQYLNRTMTGFGRDILAGWLAEPYSLSSDLSERQEIIRELAAKEEWRHRFMASGMNVPLERSRIEKLAGWLGEKPLIQSSLLKKVLICLLPAIAISALVLLIAGIINYSLFILVLLINLGYVAAGLKTTNGIHNAVSGSYGYLSSMNSLLTVVSEESFVSEHLNSMKEQVAGESVSAAIAVKKLGRLIQSFDSRLNLLAGFLLNAMLLWDYHCLRRLENWKAEFRDKFPVWLGTLGKIDAYSSLGNYAFNNQDFVYPEISATRMFSATLLGHPLIDEERRVCNDFEIDKKGTICIITGANMAGKSTFLRTVAVNYILGMTGAPVCAGHLEFTPVKLFTSMRTTDSLSGNESYFYAELKRLRNLKAKIHDDEPVFFILDEILKGTNSADKSLGSRLFIKKLIPSAGAGLIATHDTSLGELEKEHPGNIINMCFEIEIEGENIRFDYKLRKGVTSKMNAALLMRQMGILD